ncbi:MAG: UDP-N-acetylglucosamine 2-epimerase (non-hydrolyzing) [Defluviitaleaceae bacterium]|nr:UDP-N-acetylglucosamine 2-epimerase (non-hydrolyzing) [Defluviitaleaceae bacterium]
MKIMSIFGTRPEAIKMAPLIKLLEKEKGINSIVVVTGQHRTQLDQVLHIFNISPNYDLNIMKKGQTLESITNLVLTTLDPILKLEKPNIVLVHGDTTTSFAAALSAFYNQIPIGHVEAGLRTYNKYSPFPEEANRKLISALADFHFAPTNLSCENLLKENIKKENIKVTGNTALDTFEYTLSKNHTFNEPINIDETKKTILLTAHRRENLGKPLSNICEAVLQILEDFEDVHFVFPMHLNPSVREIILKHLAGNKRITLTEPLDILDMHNLLSKCYLCVTDSGGLQEEAPHLNVPVVVLREVTERPEGIGKTLILAGTEKENIVNTIKKLLTDNSLYEKMAKEPNPFGDGKASSRILEALNARK